MISIALFQLHYFEFAIGKRCVFYVFRQNVHYLWSQAQPRRHPAGTARCFHHAGGSQRYDTQASTLGIAEFVVIINFSFLPVQQIFWKFAFRFLSSTSRMKCLICYHPLKTTRRPVPRNQLLQAPVCLRAARYKFYHQNLFDIICLGLTNLL